MSAVVIPAKWPYYGEDLTQATPESLAREYLDMGKPGGVVFRHRARSRRLAVAVELRRRGYTHIDFAPYEPLEIKAEAPDA